MKRRCSSVIILLLALCLAKPFTASAEDEKQKITYYSSFSFPPYRQLTEYREHVGFEVDVAKLIFLDSPYELEFNDYLWRGRVNKAFADTGADCFGWRVITESSQEIALMSEPFYTFEFCAYSLAENNKEIETLEDLRGLRVAVRTNMQPYFLLTEHDIPFLPVTYAENAARALVEGAVDIVFDERRGMEYFLSNVTNMSNVTVYESITQEYPVGLAINPERPDLKEFVDKRIAEIKKSGELEELHYRYFGVHTDEYIEQEARKSQSRLVSLSVAVMAALAIILVSTNLINERRRKRKTRMSDERYNLLLNESEIILIDFDSNHKVLAYSESALKILDMPGSLDDFHDNFRKCIHPEDLPCYAANVDKMYLGEAESSIEEIRLRTASKEYEHFLAKAKTLTDANGKPRVCGIFINISEQKNLQEQMENTLYYDELTGVMNRGKFISECDKMILSNQDARFVLICMDVDHLTKINNLCGFDTGDSVLIQVAQAVISCIDERQWVFGRIGNDDFALLGPAECAKDVEEWFGKISETVANISVGLEIRIPVRVHGGFAFLEKGDTILSLLTKASAAQSVAKTRGDTIVDYEQGVRFLTLDRDELSRDIVEGHESGHFEMWYQPKIDLKTQKLIGMEALMRWNHPKKGRVPPPVFIEIAEQMGYIDTLDQWAITQACRQNKIWQDKGYPPVRVSANVSKALFQHVDLLESILSILEETGMDSHYLDIELTESLAVSDPDKTVQVLNRLREIGVTVSMDDFGSGYASLGTLKMLPFDTLKIDRSLIIDIDKNQTSQQIVKAIMDIAQSVNLDVVAEGVETVSQVEYLEKLDCDVIQGFYFGKPVPPDEFEANFIKYT